MGNSSRCPEDYEIVSKYRDEDWVHECTEEGLQVWRNRLSGEAAELVRLGSVPTGQDLDIFTTRMMENDLVKVHHLLIDSHSNLCTIYNSARLLIEHIPLRLTTLRNFDREEALTIFAAGLRAFHLLEIRFGPVVPHEELIGFNEQGKTKVWLNRSSWLNQPDRRMFHEEVQQQHVSTRVQMLFEMIEQRARYVLLPPVIKEEIYHPLSSHLSALKAL